MSVNEELSKLLSKYLTDNNIDDEITLVISPKHIKNIKTSSEAKAEDSISASKKNKKSESTDEELIRNFFIQNPESLINLLKDKDISPTKLAKLLGNPTIENTLTVDSEEGKEGFSNKHTLHDRIYELLHKHLHNKKSDDKSIKEGLKLVNLCNNLENVDVELSKLKKNIQDKCIHNDNVWGFVLDNKNNHIAVIKTSGKIESIYGNTMDIFKNIKSKILTHTSSSSTSSTSSTPSSSSTPTGYKIYLREPKNKSLFDRLLQRNSESVDANNIVGQVLDNDDKVTGLVLEDKSKEKFYLPVTNFTNLNLPIYGVKKN